VGFPVTAQRGKQRFVDMGRQKRISS
jgi:hypothetical protein